MDDNVVYPPQFHKSKNSQEQMMNVADREEREIATDIAILDINTCLMNMFAAYDIDITGDEHAVNGLHLTRVAKNIIRNHFGVDNG